MAETRLKRVISLPFLVFYGVGTMVGGGFYALLGKVAGEAGMLTPLALVGSGLLALLTATSFAELSSRFPVSAGEARYVREGFGHKEVARVAGILVILTGIVSAATLAVATVGFVREFVPVPERLGIALLVLLMGAVAAWGIGQSVAVVVAITIIEVGALLVVVVLAGGALEQLPARLPELTTGIAPADWIGMFAGAFLAFYAFIGFEDMVNIAEEVKDVRRSLPRAILLSVIITTSLYLIVSIVAVLSTSIEALAASGAPLVEVVREHGWFAETGLGVVSILAGLNGALVQVVMSSRVAYGLARRDQAPEWLGRVHPITRTPLWGTGAVTCIVLLLAVFFPLTALASATSSIILVVFAGVNLALWRIKGSNPDLQGEGPRFPRWLPMIAFLASVTALGSRILLLVTG